MSLIVLTRQVVMILVDTLRRMCVYFKKSNNDHSLISKRAIDI